MRLAYWLSFLIIGLWAQPALPADATFEERIAPLLAANCLECHSGVDPEAGVNLSRRQFALADGLIVPGDAEASKVWELVASGEMPPDGELSADEKRLLREWIDSGAEWGADPIDPFQYTTGRRAGYDWWSLQPLQRREAPAVENEAWVNNDIDRFILATLEAEGLHPSERAEPVALLRRVHHHATGLPPSPELVRAFEAEPSPQAWSSLVDELLDSPHYGERWARHWMDIIRFGESQGFERNHLRPDAWPYRDWLIQAFNDDLPYDDFVMMQIAGDVLEPDNPHGVTATGFFAGLPYDLVGHTEGTPSMQAATRQEELEGYVSVVGETFLGLTVNCARCHDHKFDPISQEEYYRLASALSGVKPGTRSRLSDSARAAASEERESLAARIEALEAELTDIEGPILHDEDEQELIEAGPVREDLVALFDFSGGEGSSVPDAVGGLGLAIEDPDRVRWTSTGIELHEPVRLSAQTASAELVAKLQERNEITIEAWITPANTTQAGPARVVTLSADSGSRNFTLGQDGDAFEVRLRTTNTNGNGLPGTRSPSGSVEVRPLHVIYTRDHEGQATLYLDGVQVEQTQVAGDFSNWDPGYRFAIGDELNGDRPWLGTLHRVAIYNRELEREEVRRNYVVGRARLREAAGRVTAGLQALYHFDEGEGDVVQDASGLEPPLDLTIADQDAVRWGEGLHIERPTLIATEQPGQRLVEAIQAAEGAFTLEAWITPTEPSQNGPARIVTLSVDGGRRNFTLGHHETRYQVRFRTTETDDNGLPGLESENETAQVEPTHVVFTRDRDGKTAMYLDGELASKGESSGSISNWDRTFRLALANELTNDRAWLGTYHLVAIYDRALTADEVHQNHQADAGTWADGRARRTDRLIAQVRDALPPDQRQDYEQLIFELSQLEQRAGLLRGGQVHAVEPVEAPVVHVLSRGEHSSPLHEVTPAGISAIADLDAEFGLPADAPEAERRAALARWVSHPDNPLLPRVIVNRIWHHYFGTGIVSTPNDFGFNGDKPSHPQLLDYLASELVDSGYSLKHVHRLILESATFQQSSAANSAAMAIDAENRLLWRMSPRRMDAEAYRDHVLSLAGELNLRMGGPGYRDFDVSEGLNTEYTITDEWSYERNRRTIYRTWVRAGTNPLLDALDCPNPSVATPARMETTTPVQALSLLNNAFMTAAADAFARRLQEERQTLADQIERAWQLTYCRLPDDEERALAESLAKEHGLPALCLVLFNSNEFLYLD